MRKTHRAFHPSLAERLEPRLALSALPAVASDLASRANPAGNHFHLTVMNRTNETISVSHNGNVDPVLMARGAKIVYDFTIHGGASLRVVGQTSGRVGTRNLNPSQAYAQFAVSDSGKTSLSITG
jgi:hypothetical protein